MDSIARQRRVSPFIVVLGAAAGTVAIWLFVSHALSNRQRALETWEGRLETMAEDRRLVLDHWLQDGLEEAQTIATYPTLRYVVTRAGPRTFPAEEGAREHLSRLLQQAVSGLRYEAGAVLDRSFETVVEAGSPPAGLQRKVAEVPAGVAILGSRSAPLHILFIAVVADDAGAGPLGAVVLVADPETFVFPVLRREPVASATGEAMLAWRSGDEAIFLNSARFHPGGPLSLRRPLDSPRFAMRDALNGESSFGEFLDYRGVAVLASTRRLSAAPWGLVVKVDAAEAYAPERRRLLLESAIVLGAFASFGGLVFALRRHEKGALTAALDQTDARAAALLDHANDAVLFVTPEGRIEDANRKAAELYGVPTTKLVGRSVVDLRIAGERPRAEEELRRVAREGSLVCEATHVDAGGRPRPVEVSSRLVDLGGGPKVVSIVRDITVRKEQQERIVSLSRIHRTLSDVNQLVGRMPAEDTLFEGVARTLADTGGFALALIAVKADDGRVDIVGRDGAAAAYARGLELRWDTTPLGLGPEGSALREGRSFVVPDVAAEPSFAPWVDRAREHDLRTVGAFPALVDGEALAVLAVYGPEAGAIGDEERALLRELAADLGLALARLKARATQEETDAALRAFFRSDAVGVFFGTTDGRVLRANDAYLGIVGYSRTDLESAGLRWKDITPVEHLPKDEAAIAEAREKGACTPYEKEYVRKDGTRTRVLVGFALLGPEQERWVAFVHGMGGPKAREVESFGGPRAREGQ